jgi:hypothetical protein
MTAGALDETGQEKAGEATAGVKRQYMGYAGRVANGISTVHLSPDLAFRTKGQLAIDVCADAYADGIRFDFICGESPGCRYYPQSPDVKSRHPVNGYARFAGKELTEKPNRHSSPQIGVLHFIWAFHHVQS